MRTWPQVGVRLARGLGLVAVAVLLLLVGVAALLQTAWARDQLRSIIVSQANHYLSATLAIGGLNGSLFRGIELDDVRLSRDGATLVAIEHVAVSYGLRELVTDGTTIRRLSLTRPRIRASRQEDGRWNLAALLKRDAQRAGAPGSARPIRIGNVEVIDGWMTLEGDTAFGAAHIPTSFSHLSASLSLVYRPSAWTLDFAHASFAGGAPDLTVRDLNGTVTGIDDGWEFSALHVVTPRSEFTLNGRIDRQHSPTRLDLTVSAPSFAFQEWSGVLHGLGNLAVESALELRLTGPLAAIATRVALRSAGGDVSGDLVLDTTVSGWHAKGDAVVQRLDLARWLNRPDRPSDISGALHLDLDLQLGGHFPRGAFTFRGPHARYLEYEADDIVARGTITSSDVRIAAATATSYGANLRLAGSAIAVDAPYPFRLVGTAKGADLRQVPLTVPVPHVESSLAFDFDVTGQFATPFIQGTAAFADSQFLGAQLGAGATGSIDTQHVPIRYAGAGELRNVDLNHFGERLQIGWLTDPRYDGSLRGHFHVDGEGSELATMVLDGGGRLEDADMFHGRLSDAEVSVSISSGSLDATYDGTLLGIDPSIAMDDPLYAASLTGQARGRFVVRDLMVRSPELKDYTVQASIVARDSFVRGIEVSGGDARVSLADGTMQIERLVATGPAVDLEASGMLELDGVRGSRLDYRVTRGDLARLRAVLGRDMSGQAASSGQLTGPLDRMRYVGDGSVRSLSVSGFDATTTSATYDVTIPRDDPTRARGSVKAQLSGVMAFGQAMPQLEGDASYDSGRIVARLDGVVRGGLNASVAGTFVLDASARQLDVDALTLAALRTSWRLAAGGRPRLTWSATGFAVDALNLVDAATGEQYLSASGTWAETGEGHLRLMARDVSVEALTTASDSSLVGIGGLLGATVLITGTLDHPAVSADFAVTHGRVRRMPYQLLSGHADYLDGALQLDARLDQAPGVWLTGTGSVPFSMFGGAVSAKPMHLALKSSPVSLSLLEGVTDLVRNVNGQMLLDVTVDGVTSDPHFSGRVDLTNAAFDVVSSGARYRKGRLALQLASDRIGVEAFHLEDENGHPLEITGSLGTHERRVGDLQVAVNAHGFQILRNEYGNVNIDAQLSLVGRFESPLLAGRVTLTGGSLNVDRILDRALFQPYSTQATPRTGLDPIVALNPWERMGLDIELRVPGTLRMLGENVQVSPGTPLGLGNINLRAFGDLYLSKGPAQPMYVTGSFDSVTGKYAFQGRSFDLDSSSSINFRGDLNPELYVTVRRIISGVETRVSIIGPLQQPELRLASTPPLDSSDILSLIVFNMSTNALSALQQQQLAVRAGTLAAGFIAAPMVAALERTLGIDTLEIEPGADFRGGPRVTVGNEFAPGLVARFSRQFGEFDYDEATLEYNLSRILRIRATFSDAGTLTARSPFRRVERAGIDLLLFFSF